MKTYVMALPVAFLTALAALLLVMLAALLWKMLRCPHAWELVDKTELPSGFENMAKAGARSGSIFSSDVPELSRRTIILALRCPKCGKAKIWKSNR